MALLNLRTARRGEASRVGWKSCVGQHPNGDHEQASPILHEGCLAHRLWWCIRRGTLNLPAPARPWSPLVTGILHITAQICVAPGPPARSACLCLRAEHKSQRAHAAVARSRWRLSRPAMQVAGWQTLGGGCCLERG